MAPDSISSCSKAPRGLFVLVQIDGIFTANAFSPSPSLRQCPYRYTIRAGRNLPDKEFRYLRTVIVTAAVHRGFSSNREALPLTFRHWAGVSPYTSTFVLAETCVFGKQSHGRFRCGLIRHAATSKSCNALWINTFSACLEQRAAQGSPYPEVTDAVLPSSLAKVLSYTLVCSTWAPYSVCGTGGQRFGTPRLFWSTWLTQVPADRGQLVPVTLRLTAPKGTVNLDA